MYALERAIIEGGQVLIDAGVPEDWIQPLIEEASRHIKLKEVVVRYKLVLQSIKPDGVERVKKCLESIAETLDSKGIRYRLYTAGSPRYILEVYATDYKTAEEAGEEALKTGEKTARELELLFLAEREKQ